LKTISATKKLQQTELYKELKENKQKSYLSGISLINKTNGEIFKMDYEFEKEHTKYNKVIDFKTVKKTFQKVAIEFKLLQTDFEKAQFRNGINYSTRYIMKYLTKDLKNGADYFIIRSLDGWKRQHKIRVITTSQLSLSMFLYKKIYYSLPSEIKEGIEKIIKEKKIPYYLYFQKNTYIRRRLRKVEKNKTSTTSSFIGDSGADFKIIIKTNRIRAPNNKPLYRITFLEIKYLGTIIYRNNNFLIITNHGE